MGGCGSIWDWVWWLILRVSQGACWEGRVPDREPGEYRQFWTRDTGFAAPAIVRLGESLAGPLIERSPGRSRSGAGAARTSRRRSTRSSRWPVDLFDYGVDSLPLAGRARCAGRRAALAREHADWLAGEVEHYVEQVVDPATGLVRDGSHLFGPPRHVPERLDRVRQHDGGDARPRRSPRPAGARPPVAALRRRRRARLLACAALLDWAIGSATASAPTRRRARRTSGRSSRG